jgi:hypothetical protein
MIGNLVNLENYSPQAMVVYAGGAMLFVAVYILVFINMFRNKVVGIPAIAFGANIAWEFLWGYVYRTDMGSLFSWGLKVYMPMSLVMGAFLLRYGYKQFINRGFRRHPAVVMGVSFVFWMAVISLLKPVDDAAGMSSVMLVNLVLSATFIPLLLNTFQQRGLIGLDKYSQAIGWLKLGGATFNSIFCWVYLPERAWVHAVCLAIISLDVTYLFLFHWLRTAHLRRAFAVSLLRVRAQASRSKLRASH